MTRLEEWIEYEIEEYEGEFGPLNAEGQAELRAMLTKTLHGQQLRCADSAGDLGDQVLAALKSVSDRARDYGLREFFRRHW